MKLWECWAFGADWDTSRLLVGEREEEVKERWLAILDDSYGWYAGSGINEVSMVEGYKINLMKD